MPVVSGKEHGDNNKFPDKLNKYYPRLNLSQTRHKLKEFSLERLNTKFSRVPILSLNRKANITSQSSTVTLALLQSSWWWGVWCG